MLTTCAAFTACTDEVENINQESRAALQLNVGVNQPTSRAIVEGKALPNGAQIGVSVVDNTGTAYQNQNYNNVLYTAAEEDGKQVWNTTANVTLSGEEATLYAYYPYTAGADITAIPVDMTETDQKDWMYATPVAGLSDGKSTAEVKLNHALTDLRLTFYKDTYSGEGQVTEFTIQSTGMAVAGTLNVKTGEITLPATPVNTITRTAAFTLTDKASATPMDVMLIPTGTEAPVTVSVTVDGHTYSASTTAFTLQKAKAYNYVMKLTSTGLEVTSVALVDWNEELLDDATFEPENDGEEDYSDWVKLTYEIDEYEVGRDIQLFRYGYDYASSVEKMAYKENVSSRAKAETQVLEPIDTYKFSTAGEYTFYVKFKDMTKIPGEVFGGCLDLTEITIPESVQMIGENAFSGCQNLLSIKMNEGLVSIEEAAFWGCGLHSIVFPNSVEKIGVYAFSECAGLETVILGENVKTIENGAFGRTSIKTIISKATQINNVDVWAFQNDEYDYTGFNGILLVPEGCASNYNSQSAFKPDINTIQEGFIEEEGIYYSKDGKTLYVGGIIAKKSVVNIKQGVEIISNKAFSNCYWINELILPNTVTSIGENAFYKCKGLTEITIPSSVQTIGEYAFSGCTGLTGELVIPNSVQTIGRSAFRECTGLKNVTIGTGIQTIEECMFLGCSGLTKVSIPNSATNIGGEVFRDCSGLKSIAIPNSIQTIEYRTFEGCTGLNSVTIGSGVTGIRYRAFYECTGLTSITLLATTAPNIHSGTFENVKTGGTFYVPQGATGYDEWMGTGNYYLGKYDWTMQTIGE